MKPIQNVKGDVTNPIGDGKKLICHCCNDVGGWGAGVVLAISKKWKDPERLYRQWSRDGMFNGTRFQLGEIQVVHVENDIDVINMIGQKGTHFVGSLPPIRYGSLMHCLLQVAEIAKKENATIHAPKFGAGLAGGDWALIESIIKQTLCDADLSVVVYEFD